jgi:hypothetical protein
VPSDIATREPPRSGRDHGAFRDTERWGLPLLSLFFG